MLIIPGIILWIALIPGLLFGFIYKNRFILEKAQLRFKFGFLYNEYT